jgi:hypothetical protein
MPDKLRMSTQNLALTSRDPTQELTFPYSQGSVDTHWNSFALLELWGVETRPVARQKNGVALACLPGE